MNERLLTWSQLAAVVPYSRQHIHRLEAAGQFPKRLQLGPNRVVWRQSEVEAWIDNRARGALGWPDTIKLSSRKRAEAG
jgi:prophage regulatory protein